MSDESIRYQRLFYLQIKARNVLYPQNDATEAMPDKGEKFFHHEGIPILKSENQSIHSTLPATLSLSLLFSFLFTFSLSLSYSFSFF